jgi:hypothetical protein
VRHEWRVDLKLPALGIGAASPLAVAQARGSLSSPNRRKRSPTVTCAAGRPSQGGVMMGRNARWERKRSQRFAQVLADQPRQFRGVAAEGLHRSVQHLGWSNVLPRDVIAVRLRQMADEFTLGSAISFAERM